MGKTISFVKGRGHISHNNRDFISNNVVPERTDWNRTYVKESIETAYDTCFGQALKDYNARQKRKDRQKHDYITEIRNSKNKEKVFYENVVPVQSRYRKLILCSLSRKFGSSPSAPALRYC